MQSIDTKEKPVMTKKEHDTGSDIIIRRIFEAVAKRKWLIISVAAIAAILCLFAISFISAGKGTAEGIIELNFPGIEKGQYPDGTKFRTEDITAPTIIQEALDKLGLHDPGVNVDLIRRDISVDPVVPKNISDKALAAIKDGRDFTYYPNQFTIQFKPSSIGLNKTTRLRMLNAIINQYEADFRDKYTNKAILGNALSDMNFDQYDYPEISMVLHDQIKVIKSYLASKSDEAPDFRSNNTGRSFTDILDSLNIVDSVDVSRLDSVIDSYNLTKDKDKLIKKYEYNIKMNELNQAKKNDESNKAIGMMDKYKQEQNALLIPGLTNGDTLSQGSFKIGGDSYYDDLAKQAADAGIQASNYLHDNEYLKKEIDQLKNDQVPEDAKKSVIGDVSSLLDSIKTNLVKLVQQTNDTATEYFDTKLSEAIVQVSPVEDKGMNKAIMVAISLVVGIIFGALAAFIAQFKKNKNHPVSEEAFTP